MNPKELAPVRSTEESPILYWTLEGKPKLPTLPQLRMHSRSQLNVRYILHREARYSMPQLVLDED